MCAASAVQLDPALRLDPVLQREYKFWRQVVPYLTIVRPTGLIDELRDILHAHRD
jgi:hypothetical protein